MANIVLVVSLLTLLAACVLSREITRNEDNDITPPPDGAGATPGLPADNGKKKKKISACKGKNKTIAQVEACKEEEKISKQVEALEKMRCRPIREKVYTKDHIPESHNAFSDVDNFDIFPKVLSVKKCDSNCSYCQTKGMLSPDGLWEGPWKRGYGDFFTCQPTETNMKNYTIRATDKHTEKEEYFHITLRNDKKCQCEQKKPRNLTLVAKSAQEDKSVLLEIFNLVTKSAQEVKNAYLEICNSVTKSAQEDKSVHLEICNLVTKSAQEVKNAYLEICNSVTKSAQEDKSVPLEICNLVTKSA